MKKFTWFFAMLCTVSAVVFVPLQVMWALDGKSYHLIFVGINILSLALAWYLFRVAHRRD